MFLNFLTAKSLQLKPIKGFTLIELLLYISIASIMLLVIFAFFFFLLQSRVKNQTITEVEQQGLATMQIITQTIRNAEVITSPMQGVSAPSLTLDVITTANDPTIFDLANNVIRIKEGTGLNVPLTNSHVIASNFSFSNLSRTGTLGIIRIQFTLSHQNLSNRNEYNFSKTFTSSASLR